MQLDDFLDYRAREQPDAQFAIHGDRVVLYRDAQEATNRLAHALLATGLEPGDRMAILAKNCIEYLLLYLAASRAGLVAVPLNYRLAPAEWSYILNRAAAKVLFAAIEFAPQIDAIRQDLNTVRHGIVLDGDGLSGWEPYRRWSRDQPSTRPPRHALADAALFEIYTSGTTGRPKGAVLTQRAVTTHTMQIGLAHRFEARERVLLVAPLFHVATANAGAFPCIAAGGCCYVQSEFRPAEVVRALSEDRIGMAILIPALIHACLTQVPDVAARKYDGLRLVHYGASPIAETTLRRALEVFRCDFSQGYGMTEMTAGITYLTAEDHRRALADQPGLLLSAGRPLLGTEVHIVDGSDRALPPGALGEIAVRGPQMMKEYRADPDASAQALRGGFLHTGDVGMLDEEGYLYVRDRMSDMILSGGENVYSRAVEDVIVQHPAVAEVAVIGIPDERWGEAVKAVVVLRPGVSATELEIIDFCRGKIAGFERPRSVDFVQALPRNPGGKVLKRVLRAPYWKGQGREVGGV